MQTPSTRPNLGDINERREVGIEGSGEIIWGTDVDTTVVRKLFQEFITTWVPSTEQWNDLESKIGLDSAQPLYKQYLQKIALTYKPFLELSGQHLKSFNNDLYRVFFQKGSKKLFLVVDVPVVVDPKYPKMPLKISEKRP